MPKPDEKPFVIPRSMVWEAWRRVKANKGAPGVDGQDLAQFEADLRNDLYKVWNRMSSGSYFPPPVKAVERFSKWWTGLLARQPGLFAHRRLARSYQC